MPAGQVRAWGLLLDDAELFVTRKADAQWTTEAVKVRLQLEAEFQTDASEKLREVKARRIEILKKRVHRFTQAEENREIVSHQLASIEDMLRLAHEQSIAIRDPEIVTAQLDALTAEVAATEETVREMESFMRIDDFGPVSESSSRSPVRVR